MQWAWPVACSLQPLSARLQQPSAGACSCLQQQHRPTDCVLYVLYRHSTRSLSVLLPPAERTTARRRVRHEMQADGTPEEECVAAAAILALGLNKK